MRSRTKRLASGLAVCAGLTLGLAASAHAQPYVQWAYGGGVNDAARGGVIQTSDGGYITVGESQSYGPGDYDVYVVKTDCCGNPQWATTYDLGSLGDDFGRKIRATPDGGYVIVGSTRNTKPCCAISSTDIFVMKIDANGGFVWANTYGGDGDDDGTNIEPAFGGEAYAVSGRTASFGQGLIDAYLMLITADGSVIWGRTYGGSRYDSFNSLVVAQNGDILGAGETYSYGGSDQIYVVRVSPNDGSCIWSYHYGEGRDEAANDIIEFSTEVFGTEVFAVAGYTTAITGQRTPYLLKFSGKGTECFCDRAYYQNAEAFGEFKEMIIANDQDLILAGTFSDPGNGPGGTNMLSMRVNVDCGFVWAWYYGGDRNEEGWSLDTARCKNTDEAGYVFAGMTETYGAGAEDEYLVGTDATGKSCLGVEVGFNEEAPTYCANDAPTCCMLAIAQCRITTVPRFVDGWQNICYECQCDCAAKGAPGLDPNARGRLTLEGRTPEIQRSALPVRAAPARALPAALPAGSQR